MPELPQSIEQNEIIFKLKMTNFIDDDLVKIEFHVLISFSLMFEDQPKTTKSTFTQTNLSKIGQRLRNDFICHVVDRLPKSHANAKRQLVIRLKRTK